MVLMWLVNYRGYLENRYLQLAVQGRYMFPVLVPFYGLVAHYLLAYWPRPVQVAVALIVAGVYLFGDLSILSPEYRRALVPVSDPPIPTV